MIYHVPLYLEVEADSPEEAHQTATDWSLQMMDDWDAEDDPIKSILHGGIDEVELVEGVSE